MQMRNDHVAQLTTSVRTQFYEHFGFIVLPGGARRLFLSIRTPERLFGR